MVVEKGGNRDRICSPTTQVSHKKKEFLNHFNLFYEMYILILDLNNLQTQPVYYHDLSTTYGINSNPTRNELSTTQSQNTAAPALNNNARQQEIENKKMVTGTETRQSGNTSKKRR